MKCRVTRHVYDFYERELKESIANGTPEDVCRAARGLVRQCFTRRSVREWIIDTAPEWILSGASSTYRDVIARNDPGQASDIKLNVKVSQE